MRKPRLRVSDAAAVDILEQADWYGAQSGTVLAQRWEKAVAAAVLRVLSRPASGTLCRFRAPELSGVRHTVISGFPKHLLFYKFEANEVLVLRVVHGAGNWSRSCSLPRITDPFEQSLRTTDD